MNERQRTKRKRSAPISSAEEGTVGIGVIFVVVVAEDEQTPKCSKQQVQMPKQGCD